MAKICKCDKCKELFDHCEHEAGTIVLSVYDSNHSSWPNGDEYDLCPKCMKIMERSILEAINND